MTPLSLRTTILGVLWLGFVGYTVWLAPLDHSETFPIVQKLLTFQVSEVNAYLFAIFWLMGVLPMIYACMMFADSRVQSLPASLYFIAANATGVLGLSPYLILRRHTASFKGQKDHWLQLLDSHSMGIGLSFVTLGLLTYAFQVGDWNDFVYQWRSILFVHLITLDFCFMNLFLPLSFLLEDDMARRGLKDRRLFWAIALLPLIGSLLYLCFRPALQDASER